MPTLTIGGQQLAYREVGEARPPLLLLHGAGGSSLHFGDLLGRLGRRRRCVALDLPGHGRSPGLDPPAGSGELLERYRDLAAEAAERLGLGRFVLCGHSMGGAVALQLALAYPDRLERLVLVASAARLAVSEALLATIRDRFDELPALIAALGYSPATDPAQAGRWAELQLQASQEVTLADFRACDGFDLRPHLREVRVPTLVISGADDRLTPPRLQQQLVSEIPRARLETLTRAGHFLIWERPEALADLIVPAPKFDH